MGDRMLRIFRWTKNNEWFVTRLPCYDCDMLMMDLDLETKLGDMFMRGVQAHIPTITMEASRKDLYWMASSAAKCHVKQQECKANMTKLWALLPGCNEVHQTAELPSVFLT